MRGSPGTGVILPLAKIGWKVVFDADNSKVLAGDDNKCVTLIKATSGVTADNSYVKTHEKPAKLSGPLAFNNTIWIK